MRIANPGLYGCCLLYERENFGNRVALLYRFCVQTVRSFTVPVAYSSLADTLEPFILGPVLRLATCLNANTRLSWRRYRGLRDIFDSHYFSCPTVLFRDNNIMRSSSFQHFFERGKLLFNIPGFSCEHARLFTVGPFCKRESSASVGMTSGR